MAAEEESEIADCYRQFLHDHDVRAEAFRHLPDGDQDWVVVPCS